VKLHGIAKLTLATTGIQTVSDSTSRAVGVTGAP